MRVTVCELPHEPALLDAAWMRLCEHTTRHATDLLVLPEFAFVEPVWECDEFNPATWYAAEALCNQWLAQVPELRAAHVVGTRPSTRAGWRFNEGYMWSAAGGLAPLRRKYFMPNEPGSWEARWFSKGDAVFPAFNVGRASFGLNICSELWALETYGSYASLGVKLVIAPRATSAATTAKWLSAGVVGAVRSGAFSVSSNRVDATGTYGGAGWIISPDGELLARTSRDMPFITLDLDLGESVAARATYPRSVFALSS